MGGLCFVCLNRVEAGVIEHIAHGKIVMGEFGGWPEPRTHDIASAFRHAGIPFAVTEIWRVRIGRSWFGIFRSMAWVWRVARALKR